MVLVTEKPSVAPLIKAMSVRFRGRLLFGAVMGGQAADLAADLGIQQLPGLAVLPADGVGSPVVYTGVLQLGMVAVCLCKCSQPPDAFQCMSQTTRQHKSMTSTPLTQQ